MDFMESFDNLLRSITESESSKAAYAMRIRAEMEFAHKFADLFPDKAEKWKSLVLKAAEILDKGLKSDSSIDIAAVVEKAEKVMEPIGKVAKEYTIHCCGHAHIDMNWQWPWHETISVTQDTFTTVDRLMDEFPDFKFSQSQASVYAGMEEYCPEVFEMIKKRIKEGRWEPTASQWVEGDKNMASGEILSRHLLYTRRYFKEKFGLPYDAIKIDWECDTFGHAHTLPSILNRGGVTRYYFHRTGPHIWLFWWEAPDGSRVLCFRDKLGYNGAIEPWITDWLIDYVKENGLKDWMFLYGVGDHGGGPTRRDLIRAAEMNSWPIYPNVILSTTDAYFSIVEKQASKLPVIKNELNYVFEGCYTSQSNIKRANRISENVIPEVEAVALVANALTGFPYPSDKLLRAWRLAMFNQFHDILPGSGVKATYEYAQGLFQEIQAIIGSIRTRALRKLASQIDTSKASGIKPPTGKMGASIGDAFGAGAGDISVAGGVSAWNSGSLYAEPVVVFNSLGFKRSEVIETKIWNRDFPDDRITVRDDAGNVTCGQVVGKGHFWGHNFTTIAFNAKDIPATGYRVFTIERSASPVCGEGVSASENVLENDFLRIEIDQRACAIKSLIDKSTGYDFVPKGGLMGVLELCEEIPHLMSSWDIGQIRRIEVLDQDGWWLDKPQVYNFPQDGGVGFGPLGNQPQRKGPNRASLRFARRVRNSVVWSEISLDAGSRQVNFRYVVDWREMGNPSNHIPMLRVAFHTNLINTKGTYEIPFGSIKRESNGQEVPALRWADLSGEKIGAKGYAGITLLNADKYGHNAEDNILRLTLIRSSYDPDPLPELGQHDIKLALIPHDGECSVSQATKGGAAFNVPMSVVSTDIHKGKLPVSASQLEVLTDNVMLAAIKKAEDSNALIVRLYEVEGKDTTAKVRIGDLVKADSPVVEVDMMEQPLKKSSAKMTGDILSVKIPAHGIVTVAVG